MSAATQELVLRLYERSLMLSSFRSEVAEISTLKNSNIFICSGCFINAADLKIRDAMEWLWALCLVS